MTIISMPTPIRFYQVKENDAGLTLNDLSQRLNVSPEMIEREKASEDPLQHGEMLFIRNA